MIWQTAALELGLCVWIVVLLVGDLFLSPTHKQNLWKPALAGILLLAGVLVWQCAWIDHSFTLPTPPGIGHLAVRTQAGSMFVFDEFAVYFKGLFLLTTAVVILMMRHFTNVLTANVGEFYLLVFSALLGMLVLASANNLLLLFIALELLTFSLYVMAAYVKTDARSIEAGLKYLILGSVSSGFLVYGISLLYGTSGGTSFFALRELFGSGQAPALAKAGMLLVLAALGFKIAAVPFHLWVPDVYEGAPTPVVALLSVGSKMAAVTVLLRILHEAFWPIQAVWAALLAALSAITMLYGNLAAIPQTNIKRLLGYSSIGHAGYLLMGLSTATPSGAQAVGFYVLAYLFSNLAAFFTVIVASEAMGSDSLEAYNGLSRRSPLLAAAMFLGLLSLAGVPPLAGFVGKLLVLLAAVEDQRLWLAAVGALNVAISLYYYLMVVRRMYLLAPGGKQPISVGWLTRLVLLFLMSGILLIGIFQEPFLRIVSSAISF